MVRFKNRYFTVEIRAKDRPDHAPFVVKKNSIYRTVMRKIEEMHGIFGTASIMHGLVARYINPYTKIALIRCRHGPHRFLATVLPLVREIDNVPVDLKLIYVGATMSKCFKYIMRYQKQCLEKYWNKMKTDSDRLQMKEALSQVHGFDSCNN